LMADPGPARQPASLGAALVGSHASNHSDASASAVTSTVIMQASSVVKVRQQNSKTINGFQIIAPLGEGTFGKVHLCQRGQGSSAERFAMKVFRKSFLRRQREFTGGGDGAGMKVRTALDKVYGEAKMLRKISHPHCVRLYAIIDDESDVEGKMYLVMEYASGGAIMDWDVQRCSYQTSSKGLVAEPLAASYLRDTLLGLDYLHTSHIAHRDIKPQNLLLDGEGRVKIADFSISIVMEEDNIVNGTEGTYYFYSPEMCRSGYKGHDGRRADVWAVGISLWAFLFGSLPFFSKDLALLLDCIAEARYELPESARTMSTDCIEALLRLLTVEPLERPLCYELLTTAWCRGTLCDSAPPPTNGPFESEAAANADLLR